MVLSYNVNDQYKQLRPWCGVLLYIGMFIQQFAHCHQYEIYSIIISTVPYLHHHMSSQSITNTIYFQFYSWLLIELHFKKPYFSWILRLMTPQDVDHVSKGKMFVKGDRAWWDSCEVLSRNIHADHDFPSKLDKY